LKRCEKKPSQSEAVKKMTTILILLSAVAVIVAGVMFYHNRRLYAQIARRSEELAVLDSVVATVNQSLDLAERLDTSLDKVLEVMKIEAGGIYLLKENAEKLVLAAHKGLPPSFIENMKQIAKGEGGIGRVAQSGMLVISKNVSSEPEMISSPHLSVSPTLKCGGKEGLRAFAGIPLKSKDKVLGVMVITSHDFHQFSQRDIQLLTVIGNQLGVAIENAQLYRRERNKSRQLTTSILEAHHRIKNNLQTVSDLLTLQLLETPQHSIPKEALKASMERINTIALVHEFLSKDADVKMINTREVLKKLVPMVAAANARPASNIDVSLHATDIFLTSKKVTSLALIVNELVNNAMRHAFKRGDTGKVIVLLKKRNEQILLQVKDDGMGLPKGFSLEKDASIGLEVSRTLAERDLNGLFSLSGNGGTTAEVRFPKE